MSRRVLPYGLIFSGSKGDKSKNLSSTGTVATSASNRAALRRRVLTKCNNSLGNNALVEQEAQLENVTVVDQESEVTIVASNGNKYRLNGNTTYDVNTQYGLYNGMYTFKNIPQEHPMAILDNSGYIIYSGEAIKKLTKTVNGISYDFYYGDISVTVAGDFTTASLYCYYHGYMGGENLLKYIGLSPDNMNLPPDATFI